MKEFFLFFVGIASGVLAGVFFATLLSPSRIRLNAKRRARKYELQLRKKSSRADRLYEIKIDQRLARRLEEADRRAKLLNWLSLTAAAAGGIGGIIYGLLNSRALFDFFESFRVSGNPLDFIVTRALAASATKVEINQLIPYIAIGILALMAVTFLVALYTLLTTRDTRANKARISAADNIVKTFGGFFVGLATTLLNVG